MSTWSAMGEPLPSPLETWPRLGDELGIELWVKRDDLLPFPLPGNKVRKLDAERRSAGWAPGDLLISNGGVGSNHCRTLATWGARIGCAVHLVLHDESGETDHAASRAMLTDLGATFDVVPPDEIAATIAAAADASSRRVHVVPGGAHTPAAVGAYEAAARATLAEAAFDDVVVASGTGATQAGIVLGAQESGARVVGVSVARRAERGAAAVRECLAWFDADDARVVFDDAHVDGGYGRHGASTDAAVRRGWSHGLPLDPVYTGKAFNGLLTMVADGTVRPGSRVLFWHTGGIVNYLESTSHRS